MQQMTTDQFNRLQVPSFRETEREFWERYREAMRVDEIPKMEMIETEVMEMKGEAQCR